MKQQLMKCSNCGTENSSQRKICLNCHENLHNVQIKKDTSASNDDNVLKKRVLIKGKEILPDNIPDNLQIDKKTCEKNSTKKNTVRNNPFDFSTINKLMYVPTLKQRIQMYRQFHSLLKSGIPLTLAMSYIEKNISYTIKPAMREIGKVIEKGGTLSEQAVYYPALFPAWEISMISAGEKSGNLVEIMDDIASQLEIELLMKTEISSKTWHLKATFFVAVLVGLILFGLTRNDNILNTLFSSVFMTGIILAIVIATIIVIRRFTATKFGGIVAYNVMSRIPMYGPILKNQSILRFVNVLSAMVHAGIGPMESLQSAANATGNQLIISKAEESSKRLGTGESLAEVVKSMNMLPPETIYLIKTGEDSGSLVEALKKTAEYIQMELTSQVKTMPAKLMLLVYFVVAILVGIILVIGYQQYAGILDKLMN